MKKLKFSEYYSLFALIGFTSVIMQVLSLREFLVIFYGNEISMGIVLANWLFWTATGSFFFGRFTRHYPKPYFIMAVLQISLAIIVPFTILLIRYSKALFQPLPGEIMGILPMVIDSFLVLAPFCILSGGLFSSGTYLHSKQRKTNLGTSSSRVYLWEAAGAGLAGVISGFWLIPHFTSLQIAFIVSFCNLFASCWLIIRNTSSKYRLMIIPTNILILLFITIFGSKLNEISLKFLWKGFRLKDIRNSIYGNLVLVETNGLKTIYQNGLVIYNLPDPASAEETVHYPLLMHSNPEYVLLISGGLNGSLQEALKHPTIRHIDYLELDPTLFDLIKSNDPELWKTITNHPQIAIHHIDGRLFLKQTITKYDVIICALPDPQTAQINRFFTQEFFQEASRKLRPDGLIAFQLTASENYISDQLAAFLRCIFQTLQTTFTQVTFIPGNTVHFFASNTNQIFDANPDTLIKRLRERNLDTKYVREYYLPFRMMPDRMQDLQKALAPNPYTSINKDFAPIAYFYDTVLWSTQFIPQLRKFFENLTGISFPKFAILIILPVFLLIFFIFWKIPEKQQYRTIASFAVIIMGFTIMCLELLLILGFQAVYGYVYHQLTLLIALFMCGLAVGSWAALRKHIGESEVLVNLKILMGNHIIAGIFPVGFFLLLNWLNRLPGSNMQMLGSLILFPLLAILSGAIGGFQFLLVSQIFFSGKADEQKNSGKIYGLDLIGGLIGAISLSVFLIPTFGFLKTALIIGFLNMMVVATSLLYYWITTRHPMY